MYKPYSDSTLMSMNKKELIEQLRVAEHNYFVTREAINQQAENVKDWQPISHGQWISAFKTKYYSTCSVCGYEIDTEEHFNYCPECGAYMNRSDNNED